MACSNKMNPSMHTTGNLIDKLRKGDAINVENQHFEEAFDLTSLQTFPVGNGDQAMWINSPMYFKNCTFKKDVLARDKAKGVFAHFNRTVIFEDCHFEGKVDLGRAVFNEKCSFKGSIFHSEVSFEGCLSKADFNLNKTLFEGELKMQNAIVCNHLLLNDALTKKNLLLQGIWVKGNFTLINARTFGYVDLASCRVDGFFNANYSQHDDRIVISNAVFNHRFEMVGAFGGSLTIKECWFSGPKVTDNIKFNQSEIRDNHEKE